MSFVQKPINTNTVRKFGANNSVTAPEDVFVAGGSFYWPTVAQSDIEVLSDSIEDDTGGTGALTVLLEGVDNDYLYQIETITMDGLTPVASLKTWLRIFRASVVTAGTALTNVGNIIIRDGAVNNWAYIEAAYGQTLQAGYTIPADFKSGWLHQFDGTLANKTVSQFAIFTLDMKEFGGAWQVKEKFQVSSTDHFVHPYAFPLKIEPKTDIRLRVREVSAVGMPVTGGFEIYLDK
jgi:hypothetical protein